MMIYRKNDAPLDFDLAKVVEQSKDNPVFYVQYAHARCASVLRQAGEAFPGASFTTQALAEADLSELRDEAELDVLRRLAQFPRVVEGAAAAHEPHRVAFYLYDLASSFHSLWNKGKDLPQLRFVNQADQKSTRARLSLVLGLKGVLAAGLAILGVTAPDEMR
jgi:arginyl-tRNA synthetase